MTISYQRHAACVGGQMMKCGPGTRGGYARPQLAKQPARLRLVGEMLSGNYARVLAEPTPAKLTTLINKLRAEEKRQQQK